MYNENLKKCDWKPCKEHRWPRSNLGGSCSGMGNVFYQQCNNCLAMKIIFEVHYEDDGWKTKKEEKIVEPEFKELLND